MSTSDLYRVSKTRTKHLAEFRNGHGTGPVIWGYLCERYLNLDRHSWLLGNAKPLWALANDEDVPEHLRLTHKFTFDGAICPCERVTELFEALSETYKITKAEHPECVNHWQAVADALLIAPPDHRAFGYGLSCTSVSDPWINWYRGAEWRQKVWDLFSGDTLYTPP